MCCFILFLFFSSGHHNTAECFSSSFSHRSVPAACQYVRYYQCTSCQERKTSIFEIKVCVWWIKEVPFIYSCTLLCLNEPLSFGRYLLLLSTCGNWERCGLPSWRRRIHHRSESLGARRQLHLWVSVSFALFIFVKVRAEMGPTLCFFAVSVL